AGRLERFRAEQSDGVRSECFRRGLLRRRRRREHDDQCCRDHHGRDRKTDTRPCADERASYKPPELELLWVLGRMDLDDPDGTLESFDSFDTAEAVGDAIGCACKLPAVIRG